MLCVLGGGVFLLSGARINSETRPVDSGHYVRLWRAAGADWLPFFTKEPSRQRTTTLATLEAFRMPFAIHRPFKKRREA